MPPMLPDHLPPAPPTDDSDPLVFDPVPRRVNRPDGWTPDRQREFIRRLAVHGSPQQACLEMGKNVTGIEAVYKVPTAHSFRAAWDEAVRIGRRARGLDGGPPHLGPIPGIQRRAKAASWPQSEAEDDPDAAAMNEEDKLLLIENLFFKWLAKVEQEREARLDGRVVEADFYLRQITFFEITFDLMCEDLVESPFEMMSRLRRGGEHILHIAATPFSQMLDEKRRELWAKMAERRAQPGRGPGEDGSGRPEHPPARYLIPKFGFCLASDHQALSKEEQALPNNKQTELIEAMQREEADAQIAWESSNGRTQVSD